MAFKKDRRSRHHGLTGGNQPFSSLIELQVGFAVRAQDGKEANAHLGLLLLLLFPFLVPFIDGRLVLADDHSANRWRLAVAACEDDLAKNDFFVDRDPAELLGQQIKTSAHFIRHRLQIRVRRQEGKRIPVKPGKEHPVADGA